MAKSTDPKRGASICRQPLPRPPRRSVAQVIATGLVCGFAALAAAAAESPEPPSFYAIQDVHVLIGTGASLDHATVVIADGLIDEVGVGVKIPDDAWVIDGSGLALYPGLIDAMTTLGQEQEEESEGGGGRGFPGAGGPVVHGPEDRPGTTPWVDAADLLVAGDARIATWREAGFTAALSVPEKGFFPGQAALIDLADAPPQDLVVAPGVAQRINLRGRGGFRNFPGSLMGGIAYVKQVLLDAGHHALAEARYASAPRGQERPQYDRTLDPIQQARQQHLPFLLPGDFGRQIDRALRLARAFDLVPVLYGGQGAYQRIDLLAADKIPVIIDLDWPKAGKDRDPDAEQSLRDLAHQRLAPAVPGMLAEAGVPFAFGSRDLAGPTQIFEGVRAAIDAGLSPDDALSAFTLGAARVLGVDDRLGSIEVGKIANLVLASAEPWVEDVEIKAVFVDGQRYAERVSDEPEVPPAQDAGGTWKLTLQTPRGNREMTAEFEMSEDGKVSGEISGERGTDAIEKGRMSGDRLSFKMTRSMGGRSMQASFSLILEGEKATGTMSAGPMTMDIVGERTAVAADEDADRDETPTVPIGEVRQALAVLEGPVATGADFAITHARVWTISGPTLDDATVLVHDGKIAQVGTDLHLPAGIEQIDAEGGSVIPGIIDAHSHIAGEGGINEGSLSVTSMVTIDDVINPDDIAIYHALAGGVTTVNVLHGSANPIGGGNAVIKLRWGQDAAGLRFAGAMPGIKFALGENPKRSNFPSLPGFPGRYPATRMGVMDVIRQAFTEASIYRAKWQAFEQAKAAGKQPLPPRRDLKLERLVEVLDGKRLVHAHCYRADEILQLMRLAEEFGFKIATLQHVLEGYKVADEIAAHGAGASTFSDWWGYKAEAYDAIPYNAALMSERGVVVSINSDSDEEMRHLNQEAAKAIRWGGMDEIAALAMVTLNPARQLRIDDRVGSIEVGKDADLVLYDGPPLSVRSVVRKTWIDGDLYFDLQADRARQKTIEAMKARLEPPDKPEDGEQPASGQDEPQSEQARTTGLRAGLALDDALNCHTSHSCREEGR